MLKKSLFAVALMAFLAVPMMAGDLKVHAWDVTCTYTKMKLDDVKVYLKMPYFIKIGKQDLKIDLVQLGSSMDFEGTAVDKDGKTPKLSANFDASLSTTITPTADGLLIQGDAGKWSTTISPSVIDGSPVPAIGVEMTITAKVVGADLTKLAVCNTYHVATVEIWVVPCGTPGCTVECP